ncbi:histidine kinase [Actinoplanes sp. NBRC 103695]|uniref:sensor histidine kinase n=1 Tax=Actinoplanes sp. NBRC 103695 TaxID=3032202 RepID=UPI0024A1B1CD|nr:histidine kinase [Actinoplanes sp. NBRC 103695]GLY97530.1 two-component sensor histidine kinase [Actinoplanes sp. NBRC 103695]
MRIAGAGRGRLAYEVGLAVALSGVTAGLTLAVGDPPPVAVAGLAVLDLALVGLRHRFPATVLIVASVAGTLLGGIDFLLLFGLAFAAGYRISGVWRLTGALAAALAGQVGAGWVKAGMINLPLVLLAAGMFVAVILFPATLARMSAQRRRILTLMHERTLQLSEQQRIVAEQARVREANRIAREMHDSLGHRLTLISLYAGALRSAPEKAEETVRLLHAASTAAMDELGHIVTILREEAPGDEPRQRATLADVDDLVAHARSAGAKAELVRAGEPVEVPAMIDQAAYRTLQEGLTNALRHARGGAIRAAVRYEEDALIVEVVNGPGRPHDGVSGGQGLYGLAERVRLAGGVLYHGAEPGGGFRLAATLPLTGNAPRTSTANAPRTSTGNAPRTSTANAPRTSTANAPRTSIANAARASTGNAAPTMTGSAARTSEPRDAGPVPPDDFGEDLRRVDRRRRAWTIGVGLGAALVLALCVGGVWLAVVQGTVSRKTYNELRVGDRAPGVREKLPDRTAELDPAKVEPPASPGADCVAYRASPTLRGDAADKGYRFCFQGDTLISKEALDDVG